MAKKNFKKGRTMKELQSYIVNNKNFSIRKQCELLEVSRSNFYYEPIGENEVNLKTMRLMDEEFLDHPTHGVLQMQDFLVALGFIMNVKRIRRLLRKMGIMAIFPPTATISPPQVALVLLKAFGAVN